jgi:flagellar basal-body rod protein FlgG
MEAQQTQLDTISNNLANVSTNGYKKAHAVFEDLMYQNLRQAGANSTEQTTLPTGLQVGLGTRAVATSRSFSQGNLQQSGNNLDVAVLGNGFFETADARRHHRPTRATVRSRSAPPGNWSRTTATPCRPGITIPSTAQSVTIGSDGTVSVTLPGQADAADGRADPDRELREPGRPGAEGPEHLRRDRCIGHRQQRHAGPERPRQLRQGFVETSNVNVVEELVAMIQTQRAYELNSKAIQTSDQMLQKLGQL